MKEFYRRATEIFLEICDLDREQQSAQLKVLCGDNSTLRERVELMLEQDGTSHLVSSDQAGFRNGLLTSTESSTETTPTPPEIQGYEVGEMLGQGGMGIVWRALQDSTRRKVALKVLDVSKPTSQRLQRRFEREVELVARLDHPNIARIYESGICQGTRYFAMELIDGTDLASHVEAAQLGQYQIVELMAQVCNAIQHAHQRGVIHRDLKPSNILVRSQDGRPFVVDFGLAKPFQETSEDATAMTVHGQLLGTVAYMSPEQASGHADDLDTRTDVYSLGVILYRLLTGQTPHDLSGSSFSALRRIAEQDVRRPRHVMKEIEADLESILLKALDRDREHRYQTGGELAADLNRFLNHEPIQARPITSFERTIRWCRRKPLVASLLAALFLVFTVGLATTSWKWREATKHLQDLTVADEKLRGERNAAINARNEAERNVYYSDIAQASLHLKANNLRQARASLDRHIPKPGTIDRRDWEWHYLDSLAQDSSPLLVDDSSAGQWILALAFSPDGHSLAVGTAPPLFTDISNHQPGSLAAYDVATGERDYKIKTRDVKQIVYSVNGRQIATLELEHNQLRELVDAIRIRNANDGTLETTIADPIQWWINQKDGTFSPGPVLKRLACNDLVCVDFDGDGDLDVIASDSVHADCFFRNNGRGSFSETKMAVSTPETEQFCNSVRFSTGDINGDGLDDILSATADFKTRVYLTTESNELNVADELNRKIGRDTKPTMLALGDLDGDGDLDLFLGNRMGANEVLLNDGKGKWTSTHQNIGAQYTYDVVLEDFDNDGDLDAYCANFHGPNRIWINDGSGTFQSGESLKVGRRDSNFLAAGDIDSDGDIDVVEGFGPCLLWRNQGDAKFEIERFPDDDWANGLGSALQVLLGDVDNDGDLDAALIGTNKKNSIWLNDSRGRFKRTLEFGNHYCTCASFADINQDGFLDILLGYAGRKHQKIIGSDANGLLTVVESEPVQVGGDMASYRKMQYAIGTGEPVSAGSLTSHSERSKQTSPCGRYEFVWQESEHNRKSGIGDEILTIKNLNTKRPNTHITGHEGPILAAEFSPDGERIATAGRDGTVRLWKSNDGAPIATHLGHTDRVIALAFHPEDQLLASGGWDGKVRLWDANPSLNRLWANPDWFKDSTYSDVAVSRNGEQVVAVCGNKHLLIWNSNSMELINRFAVGRNGRLDRFGERAATISIQDQNRLDATDTSTGEITASIELNSPIQEFAISADGSCIATVSRNPDHEAKTIICLWDSNNGNQLERYALDLHQITHLSFIQNSRQLVIQSLADDPKLMLVNVGKKTLIELDQAPATMIFCTASSEDGLLLAANAQSGALRVWDPTTGQVVWDTVVKNRHGLEFNPTGTRLAGCHADGTVIWDASTGRQLLSLSDTHRLNSPFYVPCCAFGHSGKILASTQWNRSIKLWRFE